MYMNIHREIMSFFGKEPNGYKYLRTNVWMNICIHVHADDQ